MNTRRIVPLGILATVTAVVFLSLVATVFASWVYPLPQGETLLSGAPKQQWDPRISGDYVVWTDFRNAPAAPQNNDDIADIYGLDLKTGIETRLTGAYTQTGPSISGTKVVYTSGFEPEILGDPDSQMYEYAYCLDVRTGERQRVSPSTYPDPEYPEGRDANPDDVAISGTNIVYTDGYADDNYDTWSEIYTCNVDGGAFRRLMLFKGYIASLRISGDNVVYTKESGDSSADSAVYCYNLATDTEKMLSNDPGHVSPPAISGNRVVWGDGSSTSTYGIYLYDLSGDTSTPRKLTSGPEIQSFPDIDGTKVVYGRFPTGASQIYCFDLAAGIDTPLVSGAGVHRYPPVISGNTVVFADERSGNPDLYAYQMATPTAPVVYMITASASAGGSITPNSVQMVNAGGSRSFTITPDLGYRIADVRVDGLSVGAVPSYTFTNVTTNHTIAATFASVAVAKPKPSLGTPVAPKTMKRSKYYTVYGSLRPRHTKGTKPVCIYKYKRVGSAWKPMGYVKAAASDYGSYTRYKVKMRFTSKGKWRIRAYAPADSKHAAVWSGKYDYVSVK